MSPPLGREQLAAEAADEASARGNGIESLSCQIKIKRVGLTLSENKDRLTEQRKKSWGVAGMLFADHAAITQ